MSNNRVLARTGARVLAPTEINAVAGGVVPTRLTTLVTGTSSNPDHSLDT